MTGNTTRHSLRYFADMLEYPHPSLLRAVEECAALIATTDAEAERLLRTFADYVERTPSTQLEEAYTGLFDLDPKCHLYVGYHLFGESYKRSAFLVGLKERFRASGVTAGAELPDHLTALLRFLAVTADAIAARELIEDAILPALDRITGQAPSAGYDERLADAPEPVEPRRTVPYLNVLDALRRVLRRDMAAQVDEGDGHRGERDLAVVDGREGA